MCNGRKVGQGHVRSGVMRIYWGHAAGGDRAMECHEGSRGQSVVV